MSFTPNKKFCIIIKDFDINKKLEIIESLNRLLGLSYTKIIEMLNNVQAKKHNVHLLTDLDEIVSDFIINKLKIYNISLEKLSVDKCIENELNKKFTVILNSLNTSIFYENFNTPLIKELKRDKNDLFSTIEAKKAFVFLLNKSSFEYNGKLIYLKYFDDMTSDKLLDIFSLMHLEYLLKIQTYSIDELSREQIAVKDELIMLEKDFFSRI